LILATDFCLAGNTKNIMVTGYWPPTNEMLRKFSTDPVQNPGGWQGQNWEGRGYDIYAYFPEFPGGTGSNPKGNGDFEIDYQDVGAWQPPSAPTGDFWRITDLIHPVAIMSFGQGSGPWEIEYNARNLPSSTWTNDYLSPYKPTPAPPDTTQSSGYVRHSSLPVEAIAEAINGSGLGINAWVDWDVDPGHFLCEYMAYHDGWYQNLHSDPCDQYHCVAAGFTHLAANISASNGTAGVEAALRALISHLDSQLVQYTISGTVTAGGSPLAGVTMYGLPGNPTTNISGAYTANVGAGWSGAVTLLKSGYALAQKTYSNVSANQSAQDYAASVATADTIVFDASSNASSATAGTTLSWSHTVGSGNNRVLVVGIVTEDSTASDQIISSVKFNGVNMTPASGSTKSRVVYSGTAYSSTLRTGLYYMQNPPVGTYTVAITHNGSVSYRVGGAVSLKNVKQQAPEAVVTNAATATAISTSVTIPNEGAWIVDVVGHSNSGSFTTSTATERWDKNSGYNTGGGSTKAITTPGSNTITWDYSGSSGTMVHSLAVFAPSEAVVVPPTRTLTVSTTTGGTVTQPGIGDFNYPDGNVISLVASANANYHFVNWTGTAVTAGKVADPNSPNTTATMNGNYAVQANFAIDQKSLTTSATMGGTVTTPGMGTYWYNYGANASIAASASTGYHFVNWTGTAVTAGKVAYPNAASTTVTMDANYAVQANCAIIQFGITATAWPNGSISPFGTIYKDYGSSQLFTATANTGYTVNTWSLDAYEVQTGGTTYTLENITNTHTVSVTFSQIILSISGYVVELDGNTPVECVLISADDTNTLTDANGYYEMPVEYGWSGDITPEKEGYVFEPNSDTYTDVNHNYNDMNYTATLMTFVISGYVLEPDHITPISDANVSAENSGGPWTSKYGGGSSVTDAAGYYEVVADYNWSGKVTPAKYGYAFEPNSVSYTNIISDQNYQDYIGTLLTFAISGYVRNACSAPIKGVMVSANNGGGSTSTDANGFYEVWASYNWSGTVTVSKDLYTFTPVNRVYNNVLDNQTNQNYQAANIYDLDCDGSIGYGDIDVISENWLNNTPGNISDFNADINVNFKDFAEFANIWATE